MPLSGRPLEAPVHIPHLLRAGLGQSPDNMALVSTATHCTWRDLERASDNLAGNLLGLGLSPGDRVASLSNRTAPKCPFASKAGHADSDTAQDIGHPDCCRPEPALRYLDHRCRKRPLDYAREHRK